MKKMKNRQNLQVLDGYRQSSDKRRAQETDLAREGSSDGADALRILLLGQVEYNLAIALKASEERLSALLHDRSRIGRELHDSVLHALYAIESSLAQSPQLRRDAARATSSSPHPVAGQIHKLIQDIQRMIPGGAAGTIEPFSLVSELRFLARTFQQMSRVRIRLAIDPKAEEILTCEEAHELAAISREALTNCVRHARATGVAIALRRLGARVQLRIRDNGSGFDVEHGQAKGIGFAQMEHRVRKIGGRLDIQSTVGRGTCITADVYLEPILTMI